MVQYLRTALRGNSLARAKRLMDFHRTGAVVIACLLAPPNSTKNSNPDATSHTAFLENRSTAKTH